MRSRVTITMMALLLSLSAVLRAAIAPDGAAAPAGQRWLYSATWNAFPVARGELTIEPAADRGEAVRVAGRAETMPILDLLWRMRDGFEATVDTAPPGPRRFVLRQHENSHRRETSVVRAADERRLLGRKQRPGKGTVDASTALRAGVHDPASVAYLLRSLPPELATPQTFDVFTGTKTFRLTVRWLGDERISALGRSWQARHLALSLPLASLEDAAAGTGTSDVQTGDLWVSTDDQHVPLRLSGRTYWGWVTIQLVGRRATATATS
jgi:Protein of unknown function (DUF3108)